MKSAIRNLLCIATAGACALVIAAVAPQIESVPHFKTERAFAQIPTPTMLFPTAPTPPPATSNIWTFCYSFTGQVSPCTALGTVNTNGATGNTATWVFRWQLAGINSLSGFGHVQFTLQGPASGSLPVAGIFVGAGQTTGGGKCSSNTIFCQWDFVASSPAPTAVTIGGATCSAGSPCNLALNTTTLTDVIAFTGSTTNPLMVAINVNNPFSLTYETPASTTVSPLGTPGFSANNYNTWQLLGTQQASTVQKNSGYSAVCTPCGNKIGLIVKVVATP